MEQEQLETVEYELQQRALTLKSQGRSVRQIAEMLSVSPSRVFRILKNTEESDTTSETEAETALSSAETPQRASLDELERDVAHALLSADTEHLTALLTRLQEHEAGQSARLSELRTAQAQAEQMLTDCTTAAARTTDRLARIPLEERKAEAKANYIEAATVLELAEQSAFPFSALIARVRERLQEIAAQQREAARQQVLREAAARLEAAKHEFLRALDEVEERAAAAGLALLSSSLPLPDLREGAENLVLDGEDSRPADHTTQIKFLKPWRSFRPGAVASLSWGIARALVFSGFATEVLN